MYKATANLFNCLLFVLDDGLLINQYRIGRLGSD